MPRRRNERPLPDLDFRFVDGRVIETVSGLPAYTTANHLVAITPTPKEFLPTALYFNPDGSPANEFTEYWLKRDAADFLTIWHGRVYREPPHPTDLGIDFSKDAVAAMEEFDSRYPADAGDRGELALPGEVLDRLPISRGGAQAWDKWLGKSDRRRRSLMDVPPSAWRELVSRRLALIFGRTPRDPLVKELTPRLCEDIDLVPPLDEKHLAHFAAPRTQRLFSVLCEFAVLRAEDRDTRELLQRNRDETLRSGRARVTFEFPSGNEASAAAARATKLLLLVSYVDLHQKALKRSLPNLCSAVVYEARKYVTTPASLVSQRATQSRVAQTFGVSRRQLQAGLSEIRDPKYGDRVFELAFGGRRRRR